MADNPKEGIDVAFQVWPLLKKKYRRAGGVIGVEISYILDRCHLKAKSTEPDQLPPLPTPSEFESQRIFPSCVLPQRRHSHLYLRRSRPHPVLHRRRRPNLTSRPTCCLARIGASWSVTPIATRARMYMVFDVLLLTLIFTVQEIPDDNDSTLGSDVESSSASISSSILQYRTISGRTYHSDSVTDSEYWYVGLGNSLVRDNMEN